MYDLLAGIYHKLSGFGPVHWFGEQYLQGFPAGNLQALQRLRKQKEMKHDFSEPVRVVFLQQNKVNWQVVRNIYEAMKDDSRFEAYIVTVPEKMDEDPEAAYKSLVSLYGKNAVIRSGTEPHNLFDIRQLKPDYVFYPRPYDQYLPKPYQSSVVSAYAKVCYMSYTYETTTENENDVYNGRFFRNVALFFAENQGRIDFIRKRHPKGYETGANTAVCFGYPSLSQYAHLETRPDDGMINVLWTPRWNDDPEHGGSNFLTYKDKIVDYVKAHDNVRLIFRPHPLTFYHFVSTGKMSQEEADRYLSQFDGNRMIYDNKPDLKTSFTDADILVTDISSIIVGWTLTCKPMIYCHTGANFNEFGMKMMSASYWTESWEEVEKHLDDFVAGIDPNAAERKKVLNDYMGEMKEDRSEEILDYMYSFLKQ
jgi:polyhydroxyalkanoate synthesis regulator phasin